MGSGSSAAAGGGGVGAGSSLVSISLVGRRGRAGFSSSSARRFGGSWGNLGTVIRLVK